MLAQYLDNWARYMGILRGLSEKSVKAYQERVLDFFGWLETSGRQFNSFSDVTRQDVEAYLEYLFYERSNANHTRLTKLGALSGFWRFLVYEKVVESDITAGIPRPKIRKRFIQAFTRTEVLRFFQEVEIYSEKGLRDVSILILLAFCGLRVGELCSLRLKDIIDDGEYIDVEIPDDIGKQGSSRTVDLWKAPSLFVRQWYAVRVSQGAISKSYLFVSYRKGDKVVGLPLSEKDIDRFVKRLAKAAGIQKPRVHSHMFRATHGSDLRHVKGFDIAAIAARLGHKNISTTDRYLPRRGRIRREYRSLREYWIDWERIWTGGDHDESGKP